MQIRRCLTLICVAILLMLFVAGSAAAQTFSLEQVMSSPFPTDLVTSKRGDKLAWAFDAEGKRNIWIAEGPTFAARQLTHYDKDDGQELSDLVFASSANAIAYVRGQAKNQAGEYPNPTTDASGVKQEV